MVGQGSLQTPLAISVEMNKDRTGRPRAYQARPDHHCDFPLAVFCSPTYMYIRGFMWGDHTLSKSRMRELRSLVGWS